MSTYRNTEEDSLSSSFFFQVCLLNLFMELVLIIISSQEPLQTSISLALWKPGMQILCQSQLLMKERRRKPSQYCDVLDFKHSWFLDSGQKQHDAQSPQGYPDDVT